MHKQGQQTRVCFKKWFRCAAWRVGLIRGKSKNEHEQFFFKNILENVLKPRIVIIDPFHLRCCNITVEKKK